MIPSSPEHEAAPKPQSRRQLVQTAADAMRDRILAREAGEQIGSLPSLARELGVGIVTIQQAARILEHEGVLEVKRGPGGGYYGKRPGLADLERVLGAYLRSDPASWNEIVDITSLLFTRLCTSAARCTDALKQAELRSIGQRISACEDEDALSGLESALHDILFGMVNQPLFELLSRATLGTARKSHSEDLIPGGLGFDRWRAGRMRIIAAILEQDPALAGFEADRQNRQILVAVRRLDG